MTIVPKKKAEPRPANKQGQVVVGSDNAVKSKQDGEGHQLDGDHQQLQQPQQPQQSQQQQTETHLAPRQPAANQMPAGTDSVQDDDTDYTGYNNNNSSGDGDEHTHDRRQYHHHHQQQQTHHHHNQHHPHQHPHGSKYANSKMSDSESNVNHVILITVINPHYPITVELIHQICSTYGKVNRIVIFKKNGVQAMVEFDTIEAAKRARSILHGCDIYSGCCTLKVEYAKTPKLNVHKNDSESFDYTNPNLGTGPNHVGPPDSAPSETGNQPQQHHQHNIHTSNHLSQHGGVHGYGHGSSASHNHHRESSTSKRGVVGSTGAIVGGGDVVHVAGQSNSGPHSHHHHANQFHPAHTQMQPGGQQQHSKQHPAIDGAGGGHSGLQSTNYIIGGQPPDQSGQSNNADAGAVGTFHHQDSGFNPGPRANIGNQAGATNVDGPAQANFVGGVDTFMQPTASGSGHHSLMNSHGMHGGSLYPHRNETGHHHQHQPQHHSHHTQSHYQSHHLSTRGVGGGGTAGSGLGGVGHRGHNPSFPLSISATNPLMASSGSHLAPQGTVMMVYGLEIDRVNCDRLFNLFCLYGNVVRVKFLRSKEGCAMVQMGDVIAVDRCPFTLPDGTPSFKDFMVNKNNRFRNPEVASKNKILPPSRILHFFNAPYGISDDELMMIFKQTADHEPAAIKIFTPKENVKSFSGLVTFRDHTEATEALVLCNHLSLPKAGAQHPYILRLCFSPSDY